jgi:glycosyltransferase involved in cell wall biosynthesis
MKIALDGYELGRDAKGVGRVIHNLLLRLPDLLPEDEFLIYTKENIVMGSCSPRAEEHILTSCGGYLRWQNGPLRKALKRADPDLLIASNYVLPLSCPWRSILIEHDISVISHPEWYPRRYALARRYLVGKSIEKADLVLVPSVSVEKEIRAFFEVGSDKIIAIGWGIEDKFRRAPEDEVRRWRERKGLAGKKIIGFLGSIFKRRHVPELIRAVELLRPEFPEAVLYLVGEDFGVLGRGEASPLSGREWIRWETALLEEDLPVFYSSLDAFAYLSEYEGFGFPPLEALACGTPPVLLDRSSLAEVFSGLAVMVKAPDEKEIAAALRTALTEEKTRAGILARFEQRRPQFSWSEPARELARLIGEMRDR